MTDPTAPFAPAIGGLLVSAAGGLYYLYMKRKIERAKAARRDQEAHPAE